MEFSYSYSDGTKNRENWISGKTSNPNQIIKLLDKLMAPKNSVFIHLPELPEFGTGSIDFYCLDDGRIEMEILQGCNDDFASVDISMAKQIVDTLFQVTEPKPFRNILEKLPIKWLT